MTADGHISIKKCITLSIFESLKFDYKTWEQ